MTQMTATLLPGLRLSRRPDDWWLALSAFVWRPANFEAVVARAPATGQMRRDVTAQDFLVALCGVGKMIEPGSDDGEGALAAASERHPRWSAAVFRAAGPLRSDHAPV